MQLIDSIRERIIFTKYPTSKQLVKFIIVGSLVTTVDFSIYFGLTRLISWWSEHYLYANGLSFIVAMSISFFSNKVWTFRNIHKSYTRQSIKFFIVNLIGLLGTQTILYFFVTVLDITDIIAKPVAISLVIIWNFSAYKFWVFPYHHN